MNSQETADENDHAVAIWIPDRMAYLGCCKHLKGNSSQGRQCLIELTVKFLVRLAHVSNDTL